MFFAPMNWLPRKTSANSQLTMVGFHFRKIGSSRARVIPPKTTTMASTATCIFSTRRSRSHSTSTWIAVATMIAAVAYMKPWCGSSCILYTTKNSTTGKKSKRSFMGALAGRRRLPGFRGARL